MFTGAFGDGSWNYTPTNVDYMHERLWSWVDSPPVYYAKQLISKVRLAYIYLKKIVIDSPSGLDASRQHGSFDVIQRYAVSGHMRSASVRRQPSSVAPSKTRYTGIGVCPTVGHLLACGL